MYRDTTLNNSQSTFTLTIPVFSLSNSASRPIPPAGSLMYNLDNELPYFSNGPGMGWVIVGTGNPNPIHVLDTTQSTSCSTGSITTLGGVGIEKNLNVCGTLAVAQGSTFSGQVLIADDTQSTSPTTGALVVVGGTGIQSNLSVGGNSTFAGIVDITNTTDTSSPTTGALVIAGGVGIGLNLVCGGNTNLEGNLDVEGPIYANNPANAVSTTTGALIVAGGAGIGGSVFIGGNLIVDGTNTATDLATSTPGVSVNIDSSTPTGSGQLLVTTGPQTAVWENGGGIYFPSFSNNSDPGNFTVSNLLPWMYSRSGNIVTVFGSFVIAQTNGAPADSIWVTVPIPRTSIPFAGVYQCHGFIYPQVTYSANQFGAYFVAVVGNSTNVQFFLDTHTSAGNYPLNGTCEVVFMYTIV